MIMPSDADYGLIYAIRSGTTPYVKFGHTQDAGQRLAGLQSGNPLPLTLIDWLPVPYAARGEKILHDYFRESLVRGEWYHLAGQSDAELASTLWCLGLRWWATVLAADLESMPAVSPQAWAMLTAMQRREDQHYRAACDDGAARRYFS